MKKSVYRKLRGLDKTEKIEIPKKETIEETEKKKSDE